MRVNMDSSITFDPRFKIIAKSLSISLREVIGSCFLLWLHCYQSRSERLSVAEANASAEVEGFGEAMIEAGLAHLVRDENDTEKFSLNIHGVKERIRFLRSQRNRGKMGGKASAKSKRDKKVTSKTTDQANAEANAKQTLTHSVSTGQAYSPAPSPALTPTPSLVLREEPPPENRNGIQLHETSFVPMPFADRFKAIVKRYPDKKPSVRAEAHWKLVATDEEAVAKIEAGLDAWVLCDQWFDGIGIPSLSNFLEERWFDNLPARKAKAKTVAERIDEIAAEQERNRTK